MITIQLRLPGGKNEKKEFSKTQKLLDVAKFVETSCGLSSGGFSFVVPFPRKSFNENDYSKSLGDIPEVNPNGVLIVQPSKNKNKIVKGEKPIFNKIYHIDDENEFNALISKYPSTLVFVDYFATWCGPCVMLSPIIEKFQKKYTDVIFIKVNVDKARSLVKKNSISSMPTIHFIKNKSVIKEIKGMSPKAVQEMEDVIKSNK